MSQRRRATAKDIELVGVRPILTIGQSARRVPSFVVTGQGVVVGHPASVLGWEIAKETTAIDLPTLKLERCNEFFELWPAERCSAPEFEVRSGKFSSNGYSKPYV